MRILIIEILHNLDILANVAFVTSFGLTLANWKKWPDLRYFAKRAIVWTLVVSTVLVIAIPREEALYSIIR